jgi:hypothetical protein
MGESRFAFELRKLGFREVPDLPIGLLSREEKAKRPPSFTTSGFYTFATDETGQSWMATGTISLAYLGFNDLSHIFARLQQRAGEVRKH